MSRIADELPTTRNDPAAAPLRQKCYREVVAVYERIATNDGRGSQPGGMTRERAIRDTCGSNRCCNAEASKRLAKYNLPVHFQYTMRRGAMAAKANGAGFSEALENFLIGIAGLQNLPQSEIRIGRYVDNFAKGDQARLKEIVRIVADRIEKLGSEGSRFNFLVINLNHTIFEYR